MDRFRKFIQALILSLVIFIHPAGANASTFDPNWLEQLGRDAIRSGVSEKTVQDHLYNVHPLEKPVVAQKSQAEFKQNLADYTARRLTGYNIQTGHIKMEENHFILRHVENKYGVPPPFIMSIWALESAFGKFTGDQNIIAALVTLARDHPKPERQENFRREVIEALKMIDEGYTQVYQKMGSWAGAMGDTQFMPSSFRLYGADGNGDGKIDIWNNLPDIFASTANHMAKSGWRPGERWGREVSLPKEFNHKFLTDKLAHQVNKTPSEWKNLGVTLKNGNPLPDERKMKGMIIAPDGLPGRAFLVYDNFRVIMRYNSSYNYALSVCFLAEAITAYREKNQSSSGVN